MYNCGMESVVKNNIVEKIKMYKYNTILTLVIFILFAVFGYSQNADGNRLYINENEVTLSHNIYTKNGEHYINIEDITSLFANNIYNDKISGKLIITTYDEIKKIESNDNSFVIKVDKSSYCNLEKFMNELGHETITTNGNIFILSGKWVQGTVIKNRVEVYDKQTDNVICLLPAGTKINVYVDNNIKDENKNMLNIKVSYDGKTYYGYILKSNVEYVYNEQAPQDEAQKIILVKADENIKQTTDTKNIDAVAINMYRLSGVNTLAKLEYANNAPASVMVLATISNGYKSSNYDPEIVTRMLNSESNRHKVIEQIVKGTEKLEGVNLEFSNFKITDKVNYMQFIRELAATLHALNKKIVVSVANVEYIDINQAVEIVDYIVIQKYQARTLASKTSGPISSIMYVRNELDKLKNEGTNLNKIILEIPTYTILWTERKGTVINAEQYTMSTMQSYLKSNNIQAKLDNYSGQNYINYTKGLTTYKMWLEDEYSVNEKAKLVSEYNLGGLSIYKSGMELKTIYKNILSIFN